MVTAKLPDGPKSLPLVQTYHWLTDPLGFMQSCRQRYGDIFTVRIGPLFTPQVFISDPQLIQQVFATDPNKLDSGEEAGIKSPLVGRQSMLALAGQSHRRQRKLLMPPFHGERMRTYSQLICDVTQQVTSDWKVGEPFSARPFMQEISLQVILKAVFGLEESSRYDKLRESITALLNPKSLALLALTILFPPMQRDFGAWSPWGQLMRQLQQIDDLIYAEIAERRERSDPSRTDILSLMMAAHDEQGQPMSDVELRDELMTLLLAGHETVAIALAWALYWVHYQPEVKEKLLQELDAVGERFDASAILRLPYLNAVCSETLRIYPVGMLALNRIVKSPLQIGKYQFEPGTLLVPCIYLTHHRQDLYPEPHLFKPERFLKRSFAAHEYLAFGGGNRVCIGLAFAQLEMKLILATILSNWQLELAGNKAVYPTRKGALLSPSQGVMLVGKGKRVEKQHTFQTDMSSALT
jgi:unspecific monooxygenase